MVYFEVGFKSGPYWSCNMVEVNTINEVRAAITATRYAAEHAKRHSYEDYYVSTSSLRDWQVDERKAKGMPIITMDEC